MIKEAIVIGVCLGFFAMGFTSGSLYYKNQLLKTEKAAALKLNQANQQYRQKEQQYQQISDALATQQAQYQQSQSDFKQRLNQELNLYDQLHATKTRSDHPANSACTDLGADWVRLHDSAARGYMPKDAPATSGVTASPSAAIHVITDNYNQCREAMTKLKAWQAWYQKISESSHE